MDKDIVTRLRCCSPYSEDGTINSNMRLIAEAANEITTLREQLRAAREGLGFYADTDNWEPQRDWEARDMCGNYADRDCWEPSAVSEDNKGDHARDTLARIDAMKEKPNA